MAGGKLTPRQKMINLMYLVFIAMLALNMSKEVLSAFGILNNKIVESNKITDARNQSSFEQLAQKASDQPLQYGPKKEKVEKIRALSKDFYQYIESAKDNFTKELVKDANGNLPFEQMDKGDKVDEKWFQGDKPSKAGKEFLDKIASYVAQLKQIGGSSIADAEMKKIENRFSTKPVFSKTENKNIEWLEYNYKGFPLIATVTKLSQLQADIKTTESDIINGMFQSDLVAAASLTAYQPIVVPEKTAFFQGEAVKGKIILGKFDPNLVAKSVIVNGTSVKAEAGQANFSFGAGAVGEHEINGSFNFDENGKVVSLPIKGNYVVVPRPNSANISADKMNVVYRGLPNPMTISFAGIPDNKVTASAPGMTRGSKPGQYNLNPGSGTEVTVSVTGELPDKTKVSDKKAFRIKNIPGPQGAIGGTIGNDKGAKSRLEVSQISAKLPDFLYDLNFQVTQFTFKVPGQAAIIVNGDRVNGQCKAALARAGRGDQITIYDIKTKIVGVSANIQTGKCAPVIYEIQ
ncbi:gliding motility protein GldM [Flavobacterium sp. CYK-4]|uniref:type IX secretion system motor protein PorM/GldM n=1 Tax=Flavobacterium lotistagni TaxID=2709660 RepID=UPI0014077156|nr:gliding motility protein GldM [Flavobacterium lotistagni]NHM05713.1 gliding motility protein GldM [Flavobacterium lotistagni]